MMYDIKRINHILLVVFFQVINVVIMSINSSPQFFTGNWFAVARLRGSGRFNSGQFHVDRAGPVNHITYNGARKGHCLPTGHSTNKYLGGADFELDLGDHKGIGRVLATNYNYAIVYECYRPAEDGSCPDGAANIYALSRDRELPDDVVEKMLPYIENTCVTKDDFERIPQGGDFDNITSFQLFIERVTQISINLTLQTIIIFENVY